MRSRGIHFLLNGGCACALAALAVPAFAQNQQTETPVVVGPAQLRDFQLPGTVVRPAAPPTPAAPPPAEPAPQPRAERPAPPPAERPVQAERNSAPTPSRPPPAQQAQAPRPEPAAFSQPRVASPAQPAEPMPQPQAELLPRPAIAQGSPTSPPPVADSAPAENGWSGWLLALPAGLLALLALVTVRRRRAAVDPVAAHDLPALAAPPPPLPRPKPAPRARLELEFTPRRAVLSADKVVVPFTLALRNSGDAPAGDVRRAVRMFNAGPRQDAEIGAFYTEPVPIRPGATPVSLAPGATAVLEGEVEMPRGEVRDVVVQGRRIFIPMVAFNIVYERGDGQMGQTSKSYLVGTEAAVRTDKMAPFRLDLGPRIYRSVGQRENRLARVV